MDPFRSFTPLRNPIGFGVSDFVMLALAGLLLTLILTRPWIEPVLRWFAARTGWCMALLTILPIALRLMLLPRCPVPTPSGSDDFSYILLGDTLRSFRLTNPPHPLPQFFEAIFVLQEPSYSSIYPLGQGIALALGRWLFGEFWLGVLFSIGILSALCYWMLRAWTTPAWALAGGLLAVIEFGPLNQWTNTYWGGGVSAIAGCLVFGALPRLADTGKARYLVLLGAGLGLQLLTRPFEFLLLLLCVLLFLLSGLRNVSWRRGAKHCVVIVLVLMPFAALTLAQNKAVTGNWTTLPYMLSRYQYGVPATFTIQPNPTPHRALTAEQDLDYRAQAAIHGDGKDTPARFLQRFLFRLRYYRFFLLPPLYLAALAFLFSIRKFRFAWVVTTLLIFAIGTNFYPFFYPHYVAALTCLFVLVSVKGLEWLAGLRLRGSPVGREISVLVVLLCAAQFLFWYGLHAFSNEELWPVFRYETWNFINYGDPEGRIAINGQLARERGKQLVFVHYWPQHRFHEWIHNEANIDAARVVWAGDLGAAENEKLLRSYPDRKAWLLEPDAQPPKLTPYPASSSQ
jgi:hypothetical protein